MSNNTTKGLLLDLLNSIKNGQVPADKAVETVVALTNTILCHREHLFRLAKMMDIKSSVVTVGDPDQYEFQSRTLSEEDWTEFMHEVSTEVGAIQSHNRRLEKYQADTTRLDHSLAEMWQELERYQPFADRRGFGEVWRQMTSERTVDAAAAVVWEKVHDEDAVDSVTRWHVMAVSAADAASWAVMATGHDTEKATRWSQLAIENVRNAIELEQEEKT